MLAAAGPDPKVLATSLRFRTAHLVTLAARATMLVAALTCIPGCRRTPSNSASSPSGSGPQIELKIPADNPAGGTIEVLNLPPADLARLRDRTLTRDEWTALLRVTVARAAGAHPGGAPPDAEQPPVRGTYSVSGSAVRFTPLFPFDPGRRYEVVFDPSHLAPDSGDRGKWRSRRIVTLVARPSAATTPTTSVAQIYPSAAIIPENQLRLYIHFSAPMGARSGLEHLRLIDEKGQPVEDPFLPLDVEFWNQDHTRYTVFFDPGRVKRGVLPNEQMGRSLTAGRKYTLEVGSDWRDAHGLPLKEPFRREYRVGPPDESMVVPAAWRLVAPFAGTRDPVAVTFPESLDHGLLVRALGVSTVKGERIEGAIRVEAAETRWIFLPRNPWRAGDYQLVALSFLEDLAGNRIGRRFEADQFDAADRDDEPEKVAATFRVTSPRFD